MTIPFWTSDGVIDLADLRPLDLTAEKIGGTLAKINRFGGRTLEPWSVAAHSVLVSALVSHELKPWALLHDAHEAVLGDWTTPAVSLIRSATDHDFFGAIGRTKGRIDRAIGASWQVAVQSLSKDLARADQLALLAEAFVFLDMPLDQLPMVGPAGFRDDFDRAVNLIRELPYGGDWRAARDLWISRVNDLAQLGLMAPPRA